MPMPLTSRNVSMAINATRALGRRPRWQERCSRVTDRATCSRSRSTPPASSLPREICLCCRLLLCVTSANASLRQTARSRGHSRLPPGEPYGTHCRIALNAAVDRPGSYGASVASASELIFGRADRLRVFVSSKMSEGSLKRERRAAAKIIKGFLSMEPWLWETHAKAGPFPSEEECVGFASTSDALILLLEDELTGITRKEYRAAKRAGAHLIIVHRAGVKREAALQRFIDAERKAGAVTLGYGSLGELETRLFEALKEFSVRPVRERIAERRQAPPLQTGSYDELDICVGEDESDLIPLSAAVEELRKAAADGDTDDVWETMYEYIEQALSVGMGRVAVDLVADLRGMLPEAVLDEQQNGWLLNLEGRALSAIGDHAGAIKCLDRMRQIGREQQDSDLESTALQNLGVQAVLAGDADRAAKLFHASLVLKTETGDVFGGLQVLFNQVNVLAAKEKFAEAHELIDDLDDLTKRLQTPHLRTSVHGHRALLHIAQGQPIMARPLLQESLKIARRNVLPDRELTALRNLALLDHDLGDYRSALTWGRKALAVAEALGDTLQEEIIRRTIAIDLHTIGDIDGAVAQFTAAADCAEQTDQPDLAAESAANAAACLIGVGRPQDAIDSLNAILATAAGSADEWRARQLGNLAAALSEAGESATAIATYRRAAKLTSEWHDAASFLRAAAHVALDDVDVATQAPDLLREELDIRNSNQARTEWGWEAAEMGAILGHSTQAGRAQPFFTEALGVFAAVKDLQRSFSVRNDRAIAALEAGDPAAARKDLKHSLKLARRLQDRALERQALLNLSEVERRAGRDVLAREYAEAGFDLSQALEDIDGQIHGLLQAGLIETDADNLDLAEKHFKEALKLARAIRDPDEQANALRHLGHVAFLRKRFATAAANYRRAAELMTNRPHPQLAEALGGAMMADARRGLADEATIQELIRVSQACAWEGNAASELTDAAFSLLDHRRPSDAAAVLALAVVLRLQIAMEQGRQGNDNEDISTSAAVQPLAQLVYMAVETQQRRFISKVKKELTRHLGGDWLDEAVDIAVKASSEQLHQLHHA
jgi:tetratricopeptide (TPR) repeat protein